MSQATFGPFAGDIEDGVGAVGLDDRVAATEALRADREVRLLIDAGRDEEANSLFDQQLAKVPPGLDPWTRAAILTRRAVAAWRLRRIPLALELAAEGWSDIDAEQPRGSFAADTLGRLGYLLEGIGHRRASLDICRVAVEVARTGDDREILAHCLQGLAGTLNFRACEQEAEAAEATFREAIPLFEEGLTLVADGRVHLALLSAYGAALAGIGELDRAERTAHDAIALAAAQENRWARSVANWVLSMIRRRQGAMGQAADYGKIAVDEAARINDTSLLQRYSADLADICHESGDTAGEAAALRLNISARHTAMETLQEGLGQALEQRRLAIRAQRLAMAAQEAAALDPLTGLANRLGLERTAPQILERAVVGGRVPWLVLIDVDWFKSVNDAAGHAAGDAALREIAQLLRAECRGGDVIARWAGDEFVVLLTEAPMDHSEGRTSPVGVAVAERIRVAVDMHDWTAVLGGTQRPTVSVGVATGDNTLERLFANADAALYRAKRHGRNRVEVHAPAPTTR
ncbi:GGDEF domain-containing protein [Actinokineospora auranticolor]|uniref:Diguanylate cyclase (GGDEF)-like protein n=1 Tax=Actinokineospora auranticolor TaxID=155976 RepID=A0A2S6GYT9_9PSEU|nr:GGDEF domain-containing protein [Actinokineospora auranticolor]PPK70399.1 diguanylate cyclase (GGDEF)-like protein [Actinokineospora auranticolor]